MTLKSFNLNLLGLLFSLCIFQIITMGGWSSLLFIIYGGGIYLGIFLFSVILSLAIYYRSKLHRNLILAKVPTKLLNFIFLFSVLTIVFNVGDCGDSSYKTGNFIQRIITQESCLSTTKNWVSSEYLFYGLILNLILIFVLVLISLRNAKKSK